MNIQIIAGAIFIALPLIVISVGVVRLVGWSEMVIEIRRRHALGGVTHQSLANEFGCVCSHITSIVNRKKWTHL